MRSAVLWVICIGAAGCFTPPKSVSKVGSVHVNEVATALEPTKDEPSEEEVNFGGCPIIRVGMTAREVGDIPGTFLYLTVNGIFSSTTAYHSVLQVNYKNGRVGACRAPDIKIEGIQPTLCDDQIKNLLVPGMKPLEVEQRIGVPKCGFENEPGAVHLIYPQPGIEVIFVGGKLKSWQRRYTYVPAESGQVKPSDKFHSSEKFHETGRPSRYGMTP